MPLRAEALPTTVSVKTNATPLLPGGGPGGSQRAAARGATSFDEVLGALGRRVDAGEALVGRALRSELGGLDAPALIAIQAGIYRYTEAIELAGKLVDRATNAVRTVLQSGGH
jgi:hypothetical protein